MLVEALVGAVCGVIGAVIGGRSAWRALREERGAHAMTMRNFEVWVETHPAPPSRVVIDALLRDIRNEQDEYHNAGHSYGGAWIAERLEKSIGDPTALEAGVAELIGFAEQMEHADECEERYQGPGADACDCGLDTVQAILERIEGATT